MCTQMRFCVYVATPLCIAGYRTWPTTPTAVTGGPCSDKLPNCADYPTSVCSEYRPWAQHNCRKYCAYMFCSKIQ